MPTIRGVERTLENYKPEEPANAEALGKNPKSVSRTTRPSGLSNAGGFYRFQIGREARRDWMNLDDYKVVLYRNQPEDWVAEIPAIGGCYTLMPTREEALAELGSVFETIAAEYREKGLSLPAESTAIVNA